MESKANKGGGVAALKKFASNNSIIIITVAMVLLATIAQGKTFFSLQNFMNILRNHSVIGIIAFGMAFVIITGNIDLSVGAQLVVVGAVVVSYTNATGNVVVGILLAILTSLTLSFITGLIVTKGRVPSFIVTLGMQYIYRACCMFFMKGGGFYGEVDAYKLISNTNLFDKIPMPVIYFLIMFIIYFIIAKHTKLGRHMYAVGSNEKASRLSGINTDWIKIAAFLMLGLAIAIAAVTESSRMGSINSTSSGNAYELNAIAMVVVGGVAMEGGKGTILGVLFGVLIMGIINNMITLLGVNVYLINAFKGLIIILAVLLQRKERER